MKIGIDITTLAYQGFGVTNFTYNLVKNLLIIDKINEYHLFYSSFHKSKNYSYLEEFKKLGATVHKYNIPLSVLQILWGKFDIFPVEWLIGKMDVFYFSDFLRPPLLPGTKGVTTIHDLVWKIYPQFHEQRIIDAHTIKLGKTIKYRDTILVDSLSTKNDLIKYFPKINKEKIKVLYPGIGIEFQPIIDKNKIKEVLTKYSILNTKYLLYVGAIEPRKNLVLSIEVFNELIKDDKFSNYIFVIAGRAGWKNEDVFQSIKRLKLEDKVKFTGFVDDEDLPCLYSTASLTVYLSSYEGFGLPPLESLACGTKVIAGNNSSLKETIYPDFLVDITNKNKILEKMKYLLENEIKIDSKLIQKRFNWQESAKKFLKIIGGIK
ncbi:MAG: glycosyltransferase family 1 protein [Candidatus Roizmanbacteria bacterium]|nr:glycosyltransferase family 1 protein [Candidatus Roizmanbacteria bacterium]